MGVVDRNCRVVERGDGLTRLRYVLRTAPSVDAKFKRDPRTEVSFAPMDALMDGLGGLQALDRKPFNELMSGSYNYFEDGDVLLAKVTPCFENGKKAIAHSLQNGAGFATSEVFVFRPDVEKIDARFLNYLFSSEDFRHIAIASMTGAGGLRRVSEKAILNFPLRTSSLATQRQIADFLDRETARIDLLIEKKQRFVSGVEDEFLDRISHLVTRGADKDAPQKQSGYSWHPTVPSHWTVTRLKFLCSRIVDCLHETPEHFDDGDYPSIRTSDLTRGFANINAAKRVSLDEYRHRIQRLEPEEGDILYTREGERFGLAALVPPKTKLCLGQRMMMFRTNSHVIPDYLMWSLNGHFAYNFLKQDVTGATSPHLNIFDIRNVPVFLPHIEEQRVLVREIDAYFEKKSQLVEKTLATIGRLREYRSTLITAAVTGQIDVTAHSRAGVTDRQLDAIQEEVGA